MADLIGDLIARLEARLGDGARVTLGDLEGDMRREWGGRWVYVSQRGANARRDDMIRVALRGGASTKAVAARFGLSERQVRNIARKAR